MVWSKTLLQFARGALYLLRENGEEKEQLLYVQIFYSTGSKSVKQQRRRSEQESKSKVRNRKRLDLLVLSLSSDDRQGSKASRQRRVTVRARPGPEERQQIASGKGARTQKKQ